MLGLKLKSFKKSGLDGLVTVIVPTYGHARFVRKALDTIAAQDYQAIELIVIDDCSKDDTFAQVEDWVRETKAHERFIRVEVSANRKNLGAHACINHGIEKAAGQYIAILNSDDLFAANRIGRLVEIANQTGAEFLFTGVRVVDADGTRLVEPGLPSQLEAMVDLADAFPSVSFALLVKNIAVSTGNFFFTSALAEKVGQFRNLRYCHDWDFILRACLLTEPVAVPLPLYIYRVHGTNTYTNLKKEEYLEPILVYQHFFAQGLAGNCTNSMAPLPSNWPNFFSVVASEIDNLAWASYVAGDGRIKIDSVLKHLPI